MQLVFTNQYADLFLLFNGLIILFYLASLRKTKQRAMRFGNFETLQKVAGHSFMKSHNVVVFLRLLAVTTLLVGISNPVLLSEGPSAEADYALAIDSSSSMLADDIRPNRFQAAKELSRDFVSDLPDNSRSGVISFSGEASVIQEMTSEKDQVFDAVSDLEIGDEAGTALGDAVISASSMLLATNQTREIIIVTDGRNNVGSSVNESIEYGVNNNVSVNTIGLGTQVEEPENESVRFNGTRNRFPNLDTAELRGVANRTGGEFVTVTNRSAFRSAFVDISSSENREDVSNYLILIGAVLLLLEWLLGATELRVIP
jgi:Ca-activated chloride channel family protein